jgi:hypothetical protein
MKSTCETYPGGGRSAPFSERPERV